MRKVSYGLAGVGLCLALLAAAATATLSRQDRAEAAAGPREVAAIRRPFELVPARVSGRQVVSLPSGTEANGPDAPRRPQRFLRPTMSLYEHTTSPAALYVQGCRAGRARQHGLVILAFGKLAYANGTYGTIAFNNRFASNPAITRAMKAFAVGYESCLPVGADERITLGRGTSNYRPAVPSAAMAGRAWADHTRRLATFLKKRGLDRVQAAAAIDAEPAWDPRFRATRDFFRGFRSAHTGLLLYNFGSLDGGVGAIWNLHQAYFVSGGMRYARAVPEIYNQTMAEQWAELSRLAVRHFGAPVRFAGLMTQYKSRCGHCGFTAKQARKALLRELARHPATRVRRPLGVTNIRWAHGVHRR